MAIPPEQAPRNRPLRVGIDGTSWLNRRGYGRFVHQLLEHLVLVDPSVDYTMVIDFDRDSAPPIPPGVRVQQVESGRSAAHAAAAHGRRSIADMWAVSRCLIQGKFDVIFFPTAYTYVPVRGPAPRVVVIHDVIAELFPKYAFPTRQAALLWRLKLWMARRQAAMLLTVSESSRRGITRQWGVPPDRIRVICEAAHAFFKPLTPDRSATGALQRLGLLDGRYILYVGGISPHKNLALLIDALATLRRDPSMRDIKLVLVGDYTSDAFYSAYEELRKQRTALQLDEMVLFPGYVEDADLVHLYNGASVFVLPSLMEGFGLPALEAMACGTPVIVSNRGSLPEVVDDAGLIFDPDNPEALQDLLCRVLTDADLRARLQRDGPRRAAYYSWKRAALDTLATLQLVATLDLLT
jgi:glycosyltransferase involved in cell wall biosynthesis